MNNVFLSYSRTDEQFVGGHLADALARLGYRVWIDCQSIPGSAEWWSAIVNGIANSSAVVVALSPSSCASSYVQQEVAEAQRNQRPVLPILVQPCFPSGAVAWLNHIQWIDFTREDFPTALQRLDVGLRRHGLVPVPPPPPVVPPPQLAEALPGTWTIDLGYQQRRYQLRLTIDGPGYFFAGLVFRPPEMAPNQYRGSWRIHEPSEVVLDGAWDDNVTMASQPWPLTFYIQRVSWNQLDGFNLPDRTSCLWRRG
jgi:hypothetical protein